MGKTSFTFKILLLSVAPIAVVFLVSTVAYIYSMGELSKGTAAITGNELQAVYQGMLREKSQDIADKVRLRLDGIRNEVRILAGAAQTLIDRPDLRGLGADLQRFPYLRNTFEVNGARRHANLAPADIDISMSVWGYLLEDGAAGQPVLTPDTLDYVTAMTPLKPFLHAIGKHGLDKGWLYVVGPKKTPVMTMTPWDRMPDIFDKKYPGHNQANWWDFFFPGVVEGWEAWLDEPARADQITLTPLYEDAGNTGLMVTFFAPLWDKDRRSNQGAAAVDYNVDKLIELVRHERVGQSGFAFLVQSDGHVLGLEPGHAETLGLRRQDDTAAGVTRVFYTLADSRFADLAAAARPGQWQQPFHSHRFQGAGGEGFVVTFQEVTSFNLWTGNGPRIVRDALYLGLVVPEEEILKVRDAVEREVGTVAKHTLSRMAAVMVVLLALTGAAAGFYALRETKQIRLMNRSALALRDKDFSTAVDVVSKDDLGQLALTFNTMVAELRATYTQLQDYAHTLEQRVEERTRHLQEANNELARLSNIDGLTEVHNRRHFDHQLTQRWQAQRRCGQPLGVIMVDVDHFKKYNDTYGHQAGDDCLKQVARALGQTLRRPTDYLARYGGEEFVLLVDNDEAGLTQLADSLREAVARLAIPHEASPLGRVSISLGGAVVVPDAAGRPADLVERADAALYRSKQAGRDRVTIEA